MSSNRCGWVKLSDPVYVAYHDEEWGKPLHDDRALFELFSLETQSAGLTLKNAKGIVKRSRDLIWKKWLVIVMKMSSAFFRTD